jgi:hypothetical protein
MHDGQVYDQVLGPALNLTGDAVLDKFRANAESIIGKARAERTIELVKQLDQLQNVHELLDSVTLSQ